MQNKKPAFSISHLVLLLLNYRVPQKEQGLQSTHHLFWNLFREGPQGSITWKRRQTKHALHYSFSLSDSLHTLGLFCKSYSSQFKKNPRNSLNMQKPCSSSCPTMGNSFVVYLHLIICPEIRNISMLKNVQICLEFRQQILLMFNNQLK